MFGVVVAQDREQLDTITVVGSRMSYRDLLDTPAVALVKPGDYLLQPIVLYNDTRNEQARKQELMAEIKANGLPAPQTRSFTGHTLEQGQRI